jgi:hypothetical protein
VTGGVDDVEAVVLPETGRGCRLDRDAALLLLHHEVSGRVPIVDLTDFVDLARELEDALRGGRFAGVHVSEDANVSVFAEVSHGFVGFRVPAASLSSVYAAVFGQTCAKGMGPPPGKLRRPRAIVEGPSICQSRGPQSTSCRQAGGRS